MVGGYIYGKKMILSLLNKHFLRGGGACIRCVLDFTEFLLGSDINMLCR